MSDIMESPLVDVCKSLCDAKNMRIVGVEEEHDIFGEYQLILHIHIMDLMNGDLEDLMKDLRTSLSCKAAYRPNDNGIVLKDILKLEQNSLHA